MSLWAIFFAFKYANAVMSWNMRDLVRMMNAVWCFFIAGASGSNKAMLEKGDGLGAHNGEAKRSTRPKEMYGILNTSVWLDRS